MKPGDICVVRWSPFDRVSLWIDDSTKVSLRQGDVAIVMHENKPEAWHGEKVLTRLGVGRVSSYFLLGSS